MRHRVYRAVLIGLLLGQVLLAAVANNTAGSFITVNPGVSVDRTYTLSSCTSNCILLAGLASQNTISNPIALTWDNGGTAQAMTLIPSSTINSAGNFSLLEFCRDSPTNGTTLTLHSTWNTSRPVALSVIAFQGAASCSLIDNVVTTGPTTSTNPTLTVSGADATGATLAFIQGVHSFTRTSGVDVYIDNSVVLGAGSYIIGGSGTNAHNWTASSGIWGASGFHVPAVAAGGSVRVGRLTSMGVGK